MRPEIIFWSHFLLFPLLILKALVFLHINEAIMNKLGFMQLGKKEKIHIAIKETKGQVALHE